MALLCIWMLPLLKPNKTSKVEFKWGEMMLLAMTMFHAVRIQQQGPDSAELSSVPMESYESMYEPTYAGHHLKADW